MNDEARNDDFLDRCQFGPDFGFRVRWTGEEHQPGLLSVRYPSGAPSDMERRIYRAEAADIAEAGGALTTLWGHHDGRTFDADDRAYLVPRYARALRGTAEALEGRELGSARLSQRDAGRPPRAARADGGPGGDLRGGAAAALGTLSDTSRSLALSLSDTLSSALVPHSDLRTWDSLREVEEVVVLVMSGACVCAAQLCEAQS